MLSDAELLTLAVAQMLLGFDCERRWIRHARGSQELRALFPYIPGQSDSRAHLLMAWFDHASDEGVAVCDSVRAELLPLLRIGDFTPIDGGDSEAQPTDN